jgi:hypothetical protein
MIDHGFMIDHAYGGAFATYSTYFTYAIIKDHVAKMAGKAASNIDAGQTP